MEPINERADAIAWLPAELEQVALRLARVDEAVYAIGDLAAQWSLDGPLSLQERRSGTRCRIVISDIRPVPPVLWLMFSEAINHLRAAIDNTVWSLVEREQGPVADAVGQQVAMPIYETQEKYDRWVKERVKSGLTALGDSCELGQRIRRLQPYVDVTSTVPSNDPRLAEFMGVPVEAAPALPLLRQYSNDDKHRAVRVAFARTLVSEPGRPMPVGGFPPVEVGEVLAEGTVGQATSVDVMPAAMVQRPRPFRRSYPPRPSWGGSTTTCGRSSSPSWSPEAQRLQGFPVPSPWAMTVSASATG